MLALYAVAAVFLVGVHGDSHSMSHSYSDDGKFIILLINTLDILVYILLCLR